MLRNVRAKVGLLYTVLALSLLLLSYQNCGNVPIARIPASAKKMNVKFKMPSDALAESVEESSLSISFPDRNSFVKEQVELKGVCDSKRREISLRGAMPERIMCDSGNRFSKVITLAGPDGEKRVTVSQSKNDKLLSYTRVFTKDTIGPEIQLKTLDLAEGLKFQIACRDQTSRMSFCKSQIIAYLGSSQVESSWQAVPCSEKVCEGKVDFTFPEVSFETVELVIAASDINENRSRHREGFGRVEMPVIQSSHGNPFTSGTKISLLTTTPNAKLYYKTKSNPEWEIYSRPLAIVHSENIEAQARLEGSISSESKLLNLNCHVAPPMIEATRAIVPAAGKEKYLVTMKTETVGSTIWFRVDSGDMVQEYKYDPKVAPIEFSGPVVSLPEPIPSQVRVFAWAEKPGCENSPELEATLDFSKNSKEFILITDPQSRLVYPGRMTLRGVCSQKNAPIQVSGLDIKVLNGGPTCVSASTVSLSDAQKMALEEYGVEGVFEIKVAFSGDDGEKTLRVTHPRAEGGSDRIVAIKDASKPDIRAQISNPAPLSSFDFRVQCFDDFTNMSLCEARLRAWTEGSRQRENLTGWKSVSCKGKNCHGVLAFSGIPMRSDTFVLEVRAEDVSGTSAIRKLEFRRLRPPSTKPVSGTNFTDVLDLELAPVFRSQDLFYKRSGNWLKYSKAIRVDSNRAYKLYASYQDPRLRFNSVIKTAKFDCKVGKPEFEVEVISDRPTAPIQYLVKLSQKVRNPENEIRWGFSQKKLNQKSLSFIYPDDFDHRPTSDITLYAQTFRENGGCTASEISKVVLRFGSIPKARIYFPLKNEKVASTSYVRGWCSELGQPVVISGPDVDPASGLTICESMTSKSDMKGQRLPAGYRGWFNSVITLLADDGEKTVKVHQTNGRKRGEDRVVLVKDSAMATEEIP